MTGAAVAGELPAIAPRSVAAEGAARQRHQRRRAATGALGRLEELSVWLAGVQDRCPPHPFQRVRLVVFAADHRVPPTGPAEAAATLAQLAAGGGAVNVVARQVGATVRLVDVAVDSDQASPDAVRRCTARIDVEDALSGPEAVAALSVGRRVVDEEVDRGADLLVPGALGLGGQAAAAAVTAALLDEEPVAVVARPTELGGARWADQVRVVRDATRRARPHSGDPTSVLAIAGSADLAAVAGFLAQAALRRTAVVLDGVVPTVAALLAERLAPGASGWWLAGHRSPVPAPELALRRLGLDPLLDLGVRAEAGVGAMLAVPLLSAAAAILTEETTPDPPP